MTIDDIFLRIGAEISNAITEEGWKEGRLHFEVIGDGVVGYTGEYTDAHGENQNMRIFDMNSDMSDWLVELHELTTKGGHNKWNRAVFTLSHDGDFHMDYQWDQELDDEINSYS